MIGPTDLLHPSPAPHFKTFQVFLIYGPKRPSFSTLDVNSTDIGRNNFYVLFFSGEYLFRDLN
jgi:hypothetical protein